MRVVSQPKRIEVNLRQLGERGFQVPAQEARVEKAEPVDLGVNAIVVEKAVTEFTEAAEPRFVEEGPQRGERECTGDEVSQLGQHRHWARQVCFELVETVAWLGA